MADSMDIMGVSAAVNSPSLLPHLSLHRQGERMPEILWVACGGKISFRNIFSKDFFQLQLCFARLVRPLLTLIKVQFSSIYASYMSESAKRVKRLVVLKVTVKFTILVSF